jgi:ferredoxin-nitrite reductase
MDTATTLDLPFEPHQKEYLQGFFAGVQYRVSAPFVGHAPGGLITSQAGEGMQNLSAPQEEETFFGTPVSDLCEQELWKLEQNGLDVWDRLLEHARTDKLPDKKDTFYFRFHGLFYVGPVQESLMLRCRIPAGELTSVQMHGLAEIAEKWGGGYGDLTTRANLQIREIAPRNMVKVLLRLQELGLTARGSGVDNVRNVTASPTAGIDASELIDTRPFAKGIHHYILNNRDLYGLPRKFNIAYDGGGAISVAADTNDIGFMAVSVPEGQGVKPGVYFRVELCGITGHQQFASDSGIIVRPEDSIAVAAAMIRVFTENGDRTNRKKARLKYLVDKWGIPKFLEETEKKLTFPLVRMPMEKCVKAHPPIHHGHFGAYKQKQRGLNYLGAVITVGRMKVKQMHRLAEMATNYGSGEMRLTVWQNLLLPNIPDAYVETVKRNLVSMGFHYTASSLAGGLVACTGASGCKWAASHTKEHAVELSRYLEKKLQLDHPINIHLTGCPNSCAQHYIGDIGLLGAKVTRAGEQVEGYHVVLGGRCVGDKTIGRQIFTGIPFGDIPALLENVLRIYLNKRNRNETFADFTNRNDLKTLQELFS